MIFTFTFTYMSSGPVLDVRTRCWADDGESTQTSENGHSMPAMSVFQAPVCRLQRKTRVAVDFDEDVKVEYHAGIALPEAQNARSKKTLRC